MKTLVLSTEEKQELIKLAQQTNANFGKDIAERDRQFELEFVKVFLKYGHHFSDWKAYTCEAHLLAEDTVTEWN